MAIYPGETIKEIMDAFGLDSSDLEAQTGIGELYWDSLVHSAPIDYKAAFRLGEIFGPSAEFWLNLEHNYQLAKLEERRKEYEKIAEETEED